jgi:ABC-2 type transport system permease protein
MFPYEAMPIAAQYIAEVFPATHFMRLIRSIVLKDVTIFDMGYDTFWLLIFIVAGLVFASMRFKKNLD